MGMFSDRFEEISVLDYIYSEWLKQGLARASNERDMKKSYATEDGACIEFPIRVYELHKNSSMEQRIEFLKNELDIKITWTLEDKDYDSVVRVKMSLGGNRDYEAMRGLLRIKENDIPDPRPAYSDNSPGMASSY